MEAATTVWVFKPIGWTPKDCINEYQKKVNKKMAFAGRLDPMACGLLPLIIHETCDPAPVQETKKSLQGSYKTYQFKLILGLESDTYDILGLAKRRDGINNNLLESLEKVKGKKIQSYPPYSSQKAFSPHYNKKVALWTLAKEGKLPDIMPSREIDIQSIKILESEGITNVELLDIIKTRFNALLDKTNYRNDEILACWENILEKEDNFTVYHLEARVSTGTYIRSIGHELGGLVFDIFRTSVGNKNLENKEYNKFEFVYGV